MCADHSANLILRLQNGGGPYMTDGRLLTRSSRIDSHSANTTRLIIDIALRSRSKRGVYKDSGHDGRMGGIGPVLTMRFGEIHG
jgi:hypothetical protein